MFGKDEDYTRLNRTAISVAITMTTGEIVRGYLHVSKTRTLSEELNRNEPFVELEPFGGAPIYLARTAIGSVRVLDVPQTDNLAKGLAKAQKEFDPHTVLGVPRNADQNAIRLAYLALAKLYHPDRYAQIELPEEVAAYLSAMLTRLNLAYRELKGGREGSFEDERAAAAA